MDFDSFGGRWGEGGDTLPLQHSHMNVLMFSNHID